MPIRPYKSKAQQAADAFQLSANFRLQAAEVASEAVKQDLLLRAAEASTRGMALLGETNEPQLHTWEIDGTIIEGTTAQCLDALDTFLRYYYSGGPDAEISGADFVEHIGFMMPTTFTKFEQDEDWLPGNDALVTFSEKWLSEEPPRPNEPNDRPPTAEEVERSNKWYRWMRAPEEEGVETPPIEELTVMARDMGLTLVVTAPERTSLMPAPAYTLFDQNGVTPLVGPTKELGSIFGHIMGTKEEESLETFEDRDPDAG